MTTADTIGFDRPVFIAFQCAPPLVLLNRPPPLVPAYRVLVVTGSTARAWITPPSGPCVVHVSVPASTGRAPLAHSAAVKSAATMDIAPCRRPPPHVGVRAAERAHRVPSGDNASLRILRNH